MNLILIKIYSLKLPDRYEAEELSDVSARRRALVSMQRALIKGQEIGDEKLQVFKPRGERERRRLRRKRRWLRRKRRWQGRRSRGRRSRRKEK